jgi:hypothetical protein
MPFHAGQTFLFPLDEFSTAHLWVISTEPNADDVFVIVSLTTLREAQDQTVIFRKNEHAFLKHDTCVCYRLAEATTSTRLQEFLDQGKAVMHSDLIPELLTEVLDGFNASDFTKNRIRDFVKDYKTEQKRKAK